MGWWLYWLFAMMKHYKITMYDICCVKCNITALTFTKIVQWWKWVNFQYPNRPCIPQHDGLAWWGFKTYRRTLWCIVVIYGTSTCTIRSAQIYGMAYIFTLVLFIKPNKTTINKIKTTNLHRSTSFRFSFIFIFRLWKAKQWFDPRKSKTMQNAFISLKE